jgi:ribosomal-protein-alanine N-acetyltransferase
MRVELRTERLILRKARLDDLAEVNAFMGHAGAMQYWSTPPHADLERTLAWLQAHIEADPEISLNYLIELEGRVIGEVGSFPIPEFGFILHPDYWGRGIGLEAGRAVIDHLFATRPVESLVADVDPRNASSIALLVKLGFLKTGEACATLCVGGEWVDSEYYSRTRPI